MHLFLRLVCALLLICAASYGQTARVRERRAVVEAAQKYVGVRESGDNRGKPYDLFMKPWGYPKGTPWCGLFIHQVYVDAGVQHQVKGPALASNWQTPAATIVYRTGRLTGQRVPVAGDVVLFRFASKRINHVEIIVRWSTDSDEEYFWCIGGNTSNPANSRQQGVFLKKRPKREAYLIVNRIDFI